MLEVEELRDQGLEEEAAGWVFVCFVLRSLSIRR